MNRLRDLLEAEIDADDARRAVGAIPDIFRPSGAATAAHARWEQAALQAALHEPGPEAGW